MPIPVIIKNRWGYAIAFLLLLITYFLIFFVINRLEADAKSVSHSYSIIHNLETIKGQITDAETGIRGYFITRDPADLKPYNSGSKQVPYLLNELNRLTAGERKYQPKVDSLRELSEVKLQQLAAFLTRFQQDGFMISDSLLETYDSTNLVMQKIRTIITSLGEKEQTLMNVRNMKLKGFFQTMAIMAIISLVITLVTIFYSLITYNKENRAREEADSKSRIYRMELEGRINELNKANTELSELRSIEKFAATGRIARTMAHEVRNPLTNISLASEQLKEINSDNEEAGMLLSMIDRNVSRINQLVSDLLSATRIEQLQFEPSNINFLLEEALDQAQDRLDLRHIKVEKEFDGSLPELVVDRGRIRLAFLNIIVNAIEAMKNDTGYLRLKTYQRDQKCVIEFIDNGAGMDEETSQKLFEPYFTSKAKGNGLGLTHTQSIIINHKGNIQVNSRPGKGSTFTIILPSA